MLNAQITIILIFSLLVAFFVYAKKTSIEISTKIQGEIIPFGNIRKVQNLEGGIIKKMYVLPTNNYRTPSKSTSKSS